MTNTTILEPDANLNTLANTDRFLDATGRPARTPSFPSSTSQWFGILLAVALAWSLSQYPLYPSLLASGLLAYATLLWRYPSAWMAALPALLPVLDFAPWTGHFFFDEFDMVVLTTLAVSFYRLPATNYCLPLFSRRTLALLVVFAVFYLLSLVLGFTTLSPLDANAFNNYYSPYNGLRVAKGMVWAFLLLPALKQAWQQPERAKRLFSYGILAGLAGLSAFVLVERSVFASLLDFKSDYRINALFSTMHTGGGHLESYLALAMPLIAYLFLRPPYKPSVLLAAAIIFTGSLYTLLVSFSRSGYIALSVGLCVLLVTLAWHSRTRLFSRWQPYLLILLIVSIIPVMALPVINGKMMQYRFSIAKQDKNYRANHWQGALAMMDEGIASQLLGMGLGSFPRTFFWQNNEDAHPATYQFNTENGNDFLRLRGGDALYFGQYLSINPHTPYHLSLRLRNSGGNTPLRLKLELCEKSLQYAVRCKKIQFATSGNGWQRIERIFSSGELGSMQASVVGQPLARPVQLILSNGDKGGKTLDVDNLRLTDAAGNNLIANGDFSNGMDHWFFDTDQHSPWHIFNFWVDMLFHMGWLGVGAFACVLLQALNCLRLKLKNHAFAAIQLASFSGFFIVGFVDSPFDAPRLSLLFTLMLFLALSQEKPLPTSQHNLVV
jgi:hypothetical protein